MWQREEQISEPVRRKRMRIELTIWGIAMVAGVIGVWLYRQSAAFVVFAALTLLVLSLALRFAAPYLGITRPRWFDIIADFLFSFPP